VVALPLNPLLLVALPFLGRRTHLVKQNASYCTAAMLKLFERVTNPQRCIASMFDASIFTALFATAPQYPSSITEKIRAEVASIPKEAEALSGYIRGRGVALIGLSFPSRATMRRPATIFDDFSTASRANPSTPGE